jgi:PII-like signaling protein
MKALLILVNETESRNDLPLYEAIVRKLHHLGVQGASVFRGIMGYGRGHQVHRGRLFGVSDDRPVAVVAIDQEAVLRGALKEIRTLAPEALVQMVSLEDA